MSTVSVRLFAVLREEAGSARLEVDAGTVGEILEVLGKRFGERFGRIAAAGSVVVNGERANPQARVAAGDEVALLPPVSGGAPSGPPGP